MIVIVCGPPAVGKTTVSILLRDRLEEYGLRVERLDSDQFSRNTYEQLYDRVSDSDGDEAPVDHWIIAGTFYRRRWQERFQRLDDVFIVTLTADLETCLQRNRQRAEPIDEKAVHIVWREFDEPDADLTIDTTQYLPDTAVDRIWEALEERFDIE